MYKLLFVGAGGFLGASMRYGLALGSMRMTGGGILGGFTTFSAFSYETVSLLDNGQVLRAGVYAAASVFFSLLAVFAGKATSTLF